MGKIGF